MDDRVLDGPARALLVASVDLCLARLLVRRAVHCVERTAGRGVPCDVPGGGTDELRSLREPLACVQPRCHGLVRFLTWFPVLSRLDDRPQYLVRRSSKRPRPKVPTQS